MRYVYLAICVQINHSNCLYFRKKINFFIRKKVIFFLLWVFHGFILNLAEKRFFKFSYIISEGGGDVSNLEVIENIFKDFASFYTDLLIALYLRTKHSDWSFMLTNGDYWLSHKNKTNESWTTEFFNKFIFPKVVFRLLSGSD